MKLKVDEDLPREVCVPGGAFLLRERGDLVRDRGYLRRRGDGLM
jgi:hypothetical protein